MNGCHFSLSYAHLPREETARGSYRKSESGFQIPPLPQVGGGCGDEVQKEEAVEGGKTGSGGVSGAGRGSLLFW